MGKRIHSEYSFRLHVLRRARMLIPVQFLFAGLALCQNVSNVAAREDYSEVIETLRPFVEREVAEKGLPGLSIAIVDDQQIVWAQGFGMADPKTTAATAETVYRIGSVSKLFTDIAIMQFVERGELNLDAPITEYLPDFHPNNPFARSDHAARADVAPLRSSSRTASRKLL